ncbi:MAG TPA: hypothetical protein VGI86_18565, partial [Acidimicrobiia bacterium]
MPVKNRVPRLPVAAAALVVSLGIVMPSAAHAAANRVRPLASAPWAIAIQANDNNVWTDSTASGVQQLH